MAKQNVKLPDEKKFTRSAKKTVHSDRPERAQDKAASDLTKDSMIAFPLGRSLKARMNGLVDYYGAHMGIRSQADYVRTAVREKVERDEAKYNNGKPLEPAFADD